MVQFLQRYLWVLAPELGVRRAVGKRFHEEKPAQ